MGRSVPGSEPALNMFTVQVGVWRRSYDVQPPEMDSKHPFYSQIIQNKKFKVSCIIKLKILFVLING